MSGEDEKEDKQTEENGQQGKKTDSEERPPSSSGNAEELKQAGNEAFKAKRYADAIASYTAAVALDPENHILFSNRAMCHGALGAWEMARVDAQSAMRLSSGGFPKAYFHLARAQLRLGESHAAWAVLQKALERFGRDARYCKEVGDCKVLLEEVEKELEGRLPCGGCGVVPEYSSPEGHRVADDGVPYCENCWEMWSRQNPGLAADYLKREGNKAFGRGCYEEAIGKYTSAMGLSPNHVLYSNRAMCFGALCDWKAALADAQQAVKLSEGNFPKAHYHVARAQFHLGDLEASETTLQDCLGKHEGEGSCAQEIRDCRALLLQVEQALKAKSGVSRSKAEKHKAEGNAKYKAQRYRASLADYALAIEAAEAEEASPTLRAACYGNRAAAHLMLREPKECMSDCRLALDLDMTAGKLWQRLAAAALAAGDFDEALTIVDQGLAVEGLLHRGPLEGFRTTVEQAHAMWKEACTALAAAEHGQAMRIFSSLERHGVTASERLALALGRCRVFLGDPLPVMNVTKEILVQNPQCIDAYVLRAEALHRSNDEPLEGARYDEKLQEGLKLLKRALSLDPEHIEAQSARKRLKRVSDSVTSLRDKMDSRDFDGALELIGETLSVDPQNKKFLGRLYEQRAKAQLRLKKYELAIKDSAQATYHDHEIRDAYMTRASAYQKLGKHDEAVQTYESLAQWCREELVFKRLWEAKFEMRKVKREDLYALLGVPSVASLPEIKKGYREKASEWHPDKKGHLDEAARKNSEEVFKRINEAHEILTDPVRKQWWDEGYDEEAIKEKLECKKAREAHYGSAH